MTKIGLHKVNISAAHMVHTTETKCYRLHGHNWEVAIELRGDIAEDGMIVDYGKIKEYFDLFDHRVWFIEAITNDIKYEAYREVCIQFGDAIQIAVPVITSEHMAEFFAKEIREKFNLEHVTVTVHESGNAYAVGRSWRDENENQ